MPADWQEIVISLVFEIVYSVPNSVPIKKYNFALETGHEIPEGEYRYSFTLSLVPELDGGGWLMPHPGRFNPGKVWTVVENLDHTGIFSVLSLYFIPASLCSFSGFCLFSPYSKTHTTQTSMLPAGFEPAIPAGERPQTLALDRSPTGLRCLPQADINYILILVHQHCSFSSHTPANCLRLI